jgi:trans-aconitate methyltransferase
MSTDHAKPSNPATQAVDWESRYRDGTTAWERHGPHPAFLSWRETGALSPCRILVPGAGRSPEPLALAEAGFDVTVVDAAESAVAVQQARLERLHVSARIELADLFTWTTPAPFDAIYDQTCLCALPPALWPDYAARLAGWLRPGGTLFVLFMQTGQAGGPPFHCDIAAMRALFPNSAWTWPETLTPAVEHSRGFTEQPAELRRR